MVYEEDQPLPFSLVAEQAVLGSILIAENLKSIDEILSSAEMFHDQRHQHIYQAALDLNEAGEPIDLVMLTTKLQSKKQISPIGSSYMLELASSTPTAESIR